MQFTRGIRPVKCQPNSFPHQGGQALVVAAARIEQGNLRAEGGDLFENRLPFLRIRFLGKLLFKARDRLFLGLDRDLLAADLRRGFQDELDGILNAA